MLMIYQMQCVMSDYVQDQIRVKTVGEINIPKLTCWQYKPITCQMIWLTVGTSFQSVHNQMDAAQWGGNTMHFGVKKVKFVMTNFTYHHHRHPVWTSGSKKGSKCPNNPTSWPAPRVLITYYGSLELLWRIEEYYNNY